MQLAVFVFLAVGFIVLGDVLLKESAERGKTIGLLVAVAAVMYAASAPLWAYIMQQRSLAQVGILFSVLTLLALVAISWLYYKEEPTIYQGIAVVLAIAAIILSEM